MKIRNKFTILTLASLIAISTGLVVAFASVNPDPTPKKTVPRQETATEPAPVAVDAVTPDLPQTTQPKPAPKQIAPQPNNPYVEGSSLHYVWGRRAEIGRALPAGSWGNGDTWNERAKTAGLTVDKNPEVGAVIELGAYGAGIVESINGDGTVLVRYLPNKTALFSAERAAATMYIH